LQAIEQRKLVYLFSNKITVTDTLKGSKLLKDLSLLIFKIEMKIENTMSNGVLLRRQTKNVRLFFFHPVFQIMTMPNVFICVKNFPQNFF